MHGVRSSSATGRRCRSAPFDTHAAAGWPLDDELSRLFDDFEECRAAICACVEVRRELVEALSDGAEVDPFLVVPGLLPRLANHGQIGRASCRARVCPSV